MQVCKECKSDVVERTSSTAGRVVVCIILLFIPYGFLICWVPFIFSHTYICKQCGNEGKEADVLMELDWRERDVIMEEFANTESDLKHILDKWIYDDNQLYKLVSINGQFMVLNVGSESIKPYKLVKYWENGETLDIHIKEIISELGPLSEFLLTKEELNEYNNSSLEGFFEWIRINHIVIENVSITIIPKVT